MPKALRDLLGYKIYFWSNEHAPIHVHVCKGKPTEDATKIELVDGGVRVCHNKSNIPISDLKRLVRYVAQNRAKIIEEWYDHFGSMNLF